MDERQKGPQRFLTNWDGTLTPLSANSGMLNVMASGLLIILPNTFQNEGV